MWKSRCVGVVRCVGAVVVVLWTLLAVVSAQGSNTSSKWQTLSGDAPRVIARGGFSGLFPDSSLTAYSLALLTSLPNVLLWCDVQLTKDGAGICFPNINLNNASDVAILFKDKSKVYLVNGVPIQGWFSVDFTLNELATVSLTQGVYSRTNKFDGNLFPIVTVQDVAKQLAPPGLWLNIQHDAFYTQHNLSMSSFVLSVSRTVSVEYISSPEVSFLRSIVARFKPSTTKLVFRLLGPTDIEPSTNQSYGSLSSNLTFIKTFASGILVPKAYIWPVDGSLYLQPHTYLVSDAHKEGLEVFASDFVNDFPLSYNYSSDPVNECLQFIDNGNFSVDGVLSDFPITPSATVDCFAHLAKNASKQVNVLVISQNGASGDYAGCTDLAYSKAISDGVDVLDCPVQMSEDGIPFCLGSINLIDSTTVAQSSFSNLIATIPDLQKSSGIFTFNLTWSQIQTLTPAISNPYVKYNLLRNPKFKNAGKFMTLSDFLAMTKNISSLYGVLISIENAEYLAKKQISSVPNAVLDALNKAGYDKQVMIQSSDSSVLKMFKEKSNYELVYQVSEDIRDALDPTIQDIKEFANSVVVSKASVFPDNTLFLTGVTKVAPRLQSFNLSVYVETFNNEFVSQAWDFFSDATVEINTYIELGGINGVITDFPKTSARYKRNRCLRRGNNTPSYMTPVQPGSLIQLITADYLPPAEAPFPVLTEQDVEEPSLPPVSARPPTSSPGGGSAKAPSLPSAQPKIAACVFLSSLAMLLAALLLF